MGLTDADRFRFPGVTAEVPAARRGSALVEPVAFGETRLCFPDFDSLAGLTIPDESFPGPLDYMESPAAEPAERIAELAYRQSLMLAMALAIPDSMLPGASTPDPARQGADETAVPTPALQPWVPVELRCRRRAAGLHPSMAAISLKTTPALPRFELEPVLEELNDLAAGRLKESPGTTLALPGGRRVSASTSRAIKAAAAAIVAFLSVWFGSGTLRPVRQAEQAAALTAPAADAAGSETRGEQAASAVSVVSAASEPQAGPRPLIPAERPVDPGSGPVAWVRNALAARAAVEMRDSFDRGMQAWGSGQNALPQGWSRSADGYLRSGPLALFQPSLSLRDYSLEFFGQIETKSMGWVVRAQDRKNYYAMKFTVVKPGLRPLIAIEHYPVVGGRKGRRMEVPLNVMVHNNTPYHVAVTVKGNRFTTSIEGQEVDTWIDDTLTAGGVGFFSEAGESARLYWMRVTRNQDFWGKVCAYVAGVQDGPRQTAQAAPGVPPLGRRRSREDWMDRVSLSALAVGPGSYMERRPRLILNQDRLPA